MASLYICSNTLIIDDNIVVVHVEPFEPELKATIFVQSSELGADRRYEWALGDPLTEKGRNDVLMLGSECGRWIKNLNIVSKSIFSFI